jgi:hypothetical protein
MIDTLKAQIPKVNLSAIEAKERLEAKGIIIYSKQYNESRELSYYRLQSEALRNLNCYFGAKGFVINGSLPKYYLGENVNSLTIAQTIEALERLENELDLPLLQFGIVKRLDVAFTFAVQNIVTEYLQAMQGYKNAKYNLIGNSKGLETVRYDFGKTQSLNCYNKQLETKEIPVNYAGKNLLRIEMQLKSGIQYLPVSELWQPETVSKFIIQYCNLFHKMKFKENAQTLQPMAGITAVENLHYLAFKEYCSNPELLNNTEFKNRNAKADFKSFINKGRQYAIQSDTGHSLSDELKGYITPEKLLAQIAPSANNEALEADYSTNF